MRRAIFCMGIALAGSFLPAVASAAPDAAAEPGEPQDEARIRFRRGVELYVDGAYKLARIEFERSYELSRNYKVLFNVGQVLQQLGEYARALSALEAYLREGGDKIPPARRATVEHDIAVLRTRTAALRVGVHGRGTSTTDAITGANVVFDGVPIGQSPLALTIVDAGEHRLVVTHPGYAPHERVLVLAGGDDAAVDVELAPETMVRSVEARPVHPVAPPPSPGRPEVLWTWIGTGALASASITFGALALGSNAELGSMRETSGTTTAARQKVADRAQLFSTTSDVCAVATVVTGALALYLTLRNPSGSASSRSAITFGPLSMSGHF